MSRQQTRSSGDGAVDPSLVQKKRARHRLVGAVCLSLIAAFVVPLVLESEPRPRVGDLPIEIAASAREPADAAAPVPPVDAAAAASAAGSKSAVQTVTPSTVGPVAPGPAVPAPVEQPVARQQPKPDPARSPALQEKPPLAQDRPPTRSGEPDVLARLIERTDSGAGGAAAKAVTRKFLVQIGAYSNVQSARTVSDRVVQVGLRPYQETVKTAQGDWIRVRVGPFASRQDAERAQQDLKRAGVTAAIIAL